MIVPRAIAVEGFGYGPMAIATKGFIAVRVVVERVWGAGGLLPRIEYEKIVEVIYVGTINFERIKRREHPTLRFIAMSDQPEVKFIQLDEKEYRITITQGVLVND